MNFGSLWGTWLGIRKKYSVHGNSFELNHLLLVYVPMKYPQMSNYQLAYLGVWGCILIQVGCHDAFHFCIAVFVFHRVSPICVPSVVIVAGNSTWNSRALHGALSSSSLYSSLGKKWYKIEIDFLEIL